LVLASGALKVTGSNSSVTTNYFSAGRGGDASIVLQNGAQMTSSTSAVGECCNTTAANHISVLVDGAGTVWNAGYFTAGGAAASVDVTISNGGSIQAAFGNGVGMAGTGTMLVTGTGSNFTVAGDLLVGDPSYGSLAGNGTLTVSNGGLVSAGTVTLGNNTPSTGALIVNTGGTLATGALSWALVAEQRVSTAASCWPMQTAPAAPPDLWLHLR
jgi:T5SS/PEP-CTERM-associated repeat protein